MDGFQSSSSGGVPKLQVFRPTWDEFKDFNNYIIEIEKTGAHRAGLAKVIPPPEWKPRADGYDMDIIGNIEIPAPISQVVQGKQGVYQQFNIQKSPMKVKDLRRMAESPRHCTPTHFDYEDLDRKYWRNINYFPPLYGADVSGSLTDPTVKEWLVVCFFLVCFNHFAKPYNKWFSFLAGTSTNLVQFLTMSMKIMVSALKELTQPTSILECGKVHLPGTLKIWIYTQLITYTLENQKVGTGE